MDTLNFKPIINKENNRMNSVEIADLLKSGKNYLILDVRTADEYNFGHIKGSQNIDINQSGFFEKINSLDRNANYIVHCKTNHRSQKAVDFMIEKGFRNVILMSDGIVGWHANKLPLEI